MSAPAMTRLLMHVGLAAFIVLGVWGAEMKSPGITFLVIDVSGLVIEKCIDAWRWVAAFAAIFWLGWKASEYVTRRDTLQEVAQKTAQHRLRESIQQLEHRPGRN